jgi:hypothetical protein
MPSKYSGASKNYILESYKLRPVSYMKLTKANIFNRFVPDAYSTWIEPRQMLMPNLPLH